MPPIPNVGVKFVAPGAAAFTSAVAAANKGVQGFCSSAGSASNCLTALGQIVTGALREIGALAVRGFLAAGRAALQFASNLVEASLKGSELEATSKSLYAGLVEVTRVSFAPLANQINELAKTAGPGFLGVVQAALTHLGGLGSRALVWGQNLVTQFANGIINGAVAVINALADIANQVAYWLSPGSPPRLLPDIDRWGAGAMNAYLEGFTLADFGVFRELAGTVEGYLRSLSTGKNDGLIPAILGSRDAIAAAIAQVRQTGQITTETLNGVFAALGPTSEAMREYVQATLELEQANKAVSDLERGLQNLNAAQQALLDEGTISQLELVAGDPNATAREKELARLEIEKLKMRGPLDAAREEQAAAQDAFDIAKQKVLIETETNNLLKEQVGLLDSLVEKVAAIVDKIAKGGAGGGGLVKPMLADFNLLESLLERFREPLGRLQAAWIAFWVRFLIAMRPAVEAWNNYVVPAWQYLVDTFTTTIPAIQTLIGQMVAYAIKALSVALVLVFRGVAAALIILADIWDENHVLILAATKFAFEGVVKIMLGAIVLLVATIVGGLLVIQFAFRAFDYAITHSAEIFAGALAAMAGVAIVILNLIATNWTTIWNSLVTHVISIDWSQLGRDIVGGIAAGITAAAGGLFAAAIAAALGALQAAKDALINHSPSKRAADEIGKPFSLGIAQGILKNIGAVQAAGQVAALAALGGGRVYPPANAGQIASMRGSNTYNNGHTIHYQPNYTTPARGAAQDFAIMQSLYGAAPG